MDFRKVRLVLKTGKMCTIELRSHVDPVTHKQDMTHPAELHVQIPPSATVEQLLTVITDFAGRNGVDFNTGEVAMPSHYKPEGPPP